MSPRITADLTLHKDIHRAGRALKFQYHIELENEKGRSCWDLNMQRALTRTYECGGVGS